ncbi:MAG TPA: carbohydrate-binding protein [Trebonia sp.]|nr:carbohydrate-binding protein [Trebonia sp.]
MDPAVPELPRRPRRSRPGRTRLLIATAGTALLAVACVAATAAGQDSSPRPDQARQPANLTVNTTSALTDNWYESAPYYSVLDSAAPDLGAVMSATGQKAFDMAFILADNGASCAPAWNGTDPVSSDTQVAGVISEVRSDGGDVIVSAGGYNGTKLGQVCGTAAATAAAYQQVISAYGLHAFDFDLEEPEIENTAAIDNELGAAQILQQDNPGLFISITMPSVATGANYFGQQLMDEAKTLGFTPDDYTIMPFDGGFNGGSSQVAALQGLNSQLVSTFGWSSSVAYAHEGFSGMNGRTDSAEYFYQSDFQTVLSFAQSVGLGRYTFWSVNRDRQCNPVDNNDQLSSECSGVAQDSWDFTAYTVAFAKSAPVSEPTGTPTPSSTPTGTPTPTPTTGSCTAAAWSSSATYVSGDVVSYNGDQWTASQWNYDEVPGGPSGAWNNDGAC